MVIIRNAADFGKVIAAERKRKGYTQQELADFSGVGITYLSKLENGKETAELGKALRIMSTLGIDLFALRREGRWNE